MQCCVFLSTEDVSKKQQKLLLYSDTCGKVGFDRPSVKGNVDRKEK